MILWALIEAMHLQGLQVQSFHSRACFSHHRGTATACGVSPRHLDSWLMSPELSREILLHGAESADVAVVDGKFSEALANGHARGSRLEVLCDWLDLPKLAVIDVPEAMAAGLTSLPPRVDALLLDRVADGAQAAEWRDRLESLWGLPVVGALETVEPLRAELEAVPDGIPPPKDACQLLGSFFLRLSQPERILELGYRRQVDWTGGELFSPTLDQSPLVVALAFDSALDCYFPDTLDLLEARGATVVDFSPLGSEHLPEQCDLVYLGCGHPEKHVEELSHNHCIKLALRNHLRRGGRIYAEGGGLAYLCQQIELPDGRHHRMAGIFPAIARLRESDDEPQAAETALNRDTWLGAAGTRVRGYRMPRWELCPVGRPTPGEVQAEGSAALVTSVGAIGSRLQVDFAAQPDLLPRLFEPAAALGSTDDLRKATW